MTDQARHYCSVVSDQAYLRGDQYADGHNLRARINLHRQFSTNPYDWFRWLFDHLDLPATGAILELGGGTGVLWARNAHRLSAAWDITLSDVSPGMLVEATRTLVSCASVVHYVVADAQAIPFPESSFDCVIANHMLYHVPDRAAAFTEIHRVLRPEGKLYASTVGREHLHEIVELVAQFDPCLRWSNDVPAQFGLENGAAQRSHCFTNVKLDVYDDALHITEAAPLVAFVLSSMSSAKEVLVGERRAAFHEFVTAIIGQGPLRVTKRQGLFSAHR